MKEIARRLHENRQIELAKSILESAGYKVEKIKESSITQQIKQSGKTHLTGLMDDIPENQQSMFEDMYDCARDLLQVGSVYFATEDDVNMMEIRDELDEMDPIKVNREYDNIYGALYSNGVVLLIVYGYECVAVAAGD